jgi:rhodanese-related sulfurtransferase
MRIKNLLTSTAIITALALGNTACAKEKLAVKITPTLESVSVMHNGQKVDVMRNQNQKNMVNPSFALTSRKCPPFCIQPLILAPGVETIGEVEVLDYLKRKASGDKTVVIVDSRTADWVKRGTIPSAKNIPWTKLNPAKGADPISMMDILTKEFNVKPYDELLDFSDAHTLVLFCNGMWCGQSPNNIKNLLKLGYPSHKIKWYRGGMQSWSNLGFTTASGSSN